MNKKEDDSNFPIDINCRFIEFSQKIIIWNIKILAFLMVLVILWTTFDVIYVIYAVAQTTYFLTIDMDEILTVFGAFLVVLIAIEIFLNIILYLKKDIDHLKLVVATALMAIARKVIILDYDKVADWHLIGMGALILSLGVAYWFIGSPIKKIAKSSSEEWR